MHGCGGEGSGDIYTISPGASQSYIAIPIGGREDDCWDPNTDQDKVLAVTAARPTRQDRLAAAGSPRASSGSDHYRPPSPPPSVRDCPAAWCATELPVPYSSHGCSCIRPARHRPRRAHRSIAACNLSAAAATVSSCVNVTSRSLECTGPSPAAGAGVGLSGNFYDSVAVGGDIENVNIRSASIRAYATPESRNCSHSGP